MKKLLLAIIVLSLILSMSACGQGSSPAADAPAAGAPAAGAPAADAPAPDEVYHLRFSHAVGEGMWLHDLLEGYADQLEEASNGRLEIEVYANNSLGTAEDIFTMFTEGNIDILQLGMTAGEKFFVADIVQTPFLVSNPSIASEILWTLYYEGYLAEFSNTMHVCAFLPTDMMMFAGCGDKLESVNDFAGLKFRANSDQLVSSLETLKATPVAMPPTDVFLSLSQGVINGSISSPSAMIQFGYQDAADYLCTMGVGLGVNYLGFNLDTWNSLPSDLQDIIDQVSQKFCKDYLKMNHIGEIQGIEAMAAAGVEVYEMAPETVQEIREATSYLVDEYIERVNSHGFDGEAIVQIVNEVIERCEFHIG